MRLVVWAVVLLLLAALAYTAWPLIDLYRLAGAVRSHDTAAFLQYVDLPAVRKSIAREIVDRAGAGKIEGVTIAVGPSGQDIAANLIEARLSDLITPEMLFELLRRGRPGGEGGVAASGVGSGQSPYTLPTNPLSRLKSLGFSTFDSFRIAFGEGADTSDWLTLDLTLRPRSLLWQLSGVTLPDKVFNRLQRELHIDIRGTD